MICHIHKCVTILKIFRWVVEC